MEIFFTGVFGLGWIIAFLWGLGTLRELQQGQAEVLKRLKRIDDALERDRTPRSLANAERRGSS